MTLGAVRADPLGILVAFGAGIVSFVSPCVLPLVPAYLGMVAGVRAGELPSDGRKLVRPTLLFVAGFSIVFVLLGAGASSIGSALITHRRGLEEFAGALTVAVGLLLVSGVSPRLLATEKRFHASPAALGGWAPPVMGAAFAFGWTPCIGPVLGAVLSEAAARTTLAGGMLLLAFYSLGLGVPFVAFGVASAKLVGVTGWVRRRYRLIAVGAGLVLAAWGALMVAGDTTTVSSWFSTVMRDLHLTRLTVS